MYEKKHGNTCNISIENKARLFDHLPFQAEKLISFSAQLNQHLHLCMASGFMIQQ